MVKTKIAPWLILFVVLFGSVALLTQGSSAPNKASTFCSIQFRGVTEDYCGENATLGLRHYGYPAFVYERSGILEVRGPQWHFGSINFLLMVIWVGMVAYVTVWLLRKNEEKSRK